jgi:hypothetical protein
VENKRNGPSGRPDCCGYKPWTVNIEQIDPVAGGQLADALGGSGKMSRKPNDVHDRFAPCRVCFTRKVFDVCTGSMCPFEQCTVARRRQHGFPTDLAERRKQIEKTMLCAPKIAILIEQEKIHLE